MAERLVLCGEARGSDNALRLSLSGNRANVKLQMQDLSRRLVANVPDLFTDLVETAAYIHCADQAASRGGDARKGLGADWRRQFHFVIPVRDPDRWSSPEVAEALTSLLGFLSEDEFRFEFIKQRAPPPFQTYLELGQERSDAFQADEIILFSGGIDSLCGAIEELVRGRRRLALVSHNSSSKIYNRQSYLAAELRRRFPGETLHIPVLITKQQSVGHVEGTQRTRTFLFGALAIAVAHFFRRQRIRFCENGIVSFNLPIAGQVIGTQATRTTHPRVVHDLGRFLTLLFQKEIAVENPFFWKTRSEVATIVRKHGLADLLRHSVSCSHVHVMSRLHTHCGACSQCIDRRFAMLAAGAEQDDPAEMYRVDLLTGERETGNQRSMAESYVRSALEFRRMTPEGFMSRYAGEISRAAFAFPGKTADEVARCAFDLHRRHGDAVHSVLTAGIHRFAEELVSRTLPGRCILRMAVSEHARDFDSRPIRAPVGEDRSSTDRDPRAFGHSSEIHLALDENAGGILISGLPAIKSKASYALFEVLAANYRTDVHRGRAPKNFKYTSAGSLAKALSIEEATLRRRVTRVRKAVANLFEEHLGFPMTKDDLIETKGWQGYRINPKVRIVATGELEIARHGFRPKRHNS